MKRVGSVCLWGMLAGVVLFAMADRAAAQAAPPAPAPAPSPDASAVAADDIKQDRGAAAGTRLRGAWANLKYLHTAGGGCMWGIDVLVILGVAFILERVVRMRRKRVLPISVLKPVMESMEKGDFAAAAEICRKHPRNTLSRAVAFLDSPEGKAASADERDAAVNEIASRDVDTHRMMCFPLASIAALAPLIGLQGTVVGIRECFRDVALAGEMGNPAMLAGGIEKALITTIYGLLIAIPTVFFFNVFKLRINLLANELEEALSTILRRYATMKGKAK